MMSAAFRPAEETTGKKYNDDTHRNLVSARQ